MPLFTSEFCKVECSNWEQEIRLEFTALMENYKYTILASLDFIYWRLHPPNSMAQPTSFRNWNFD